ncbi:hypothetical protein EB796_019949 [Bugula neritina]|uniref:Uncharacterized protein n=1 Tax=Bugula neritina TaxID=10212 RepID=A0A7J7J6U2_BUGNE|nr:hypothetical protein EB796_019949 [Bugula neritina]
MLVISMVTLVTLVAASTPLTELSTITSRHTKLSSVSPSSRQRKEWGKDTAYNLPVARAANEDVGRGFENLIELFRNLSGPTIDVPSYLLEEYGSSSKAPAVAPFEQANEYNISNDTDIPVTLEKVGDNGSGEEETESVLDIL